MKWLRVFKSLLPVKDKATYVDSEVLYIDRALCALRDRQQSITVQFYRCQTPFVSTILYVDPTREFILLDEMNHNEGNLLAVNAEPFAVKAQYGEELVIFEGKVNRIQAMRGIRCYRVDYPKAMAHSKRRGCPRFVLPDDKKADLFVTHLPHIKAIIKDISMVGVAIAIPRQLRHVLHALLDGTESRLILPNAPGQGFAITVKNYRNDFDHQQLILGCEFVNLDNTRLKLLAKLLTQAA
ncbi:MAG: flagellar regulator YcgR PilZN domain-containing protein [Candidatus Berkiella sp.]